MTYVHLPASTPQLLRNHGLKVAEVDGWFGRGRPASTGGHNPVGVLCHHTATRKSSSDAAVIRLLRMGRSDLPGPLCNFGLGRDGTVYVVASGRANHAGRAKSAGTVAAGDGNELYWGIEAFNDGVGEAWPDVQYDAYVQLCAVLSKFVTKNSVNTVHGHKETSVTGKIDPTFPMGPFRDRVAAAMRDLDPAKPKPVVKKPTRPAQPAPVPSGPHKDFRVNLVPANKTQTIRSIKLDMAEVLKKSGPNTVIFNTERSTDLQRQAVIDGLGKGWTQAFNNENVIDYGENWTQNGDAEALLLAKVDPSMAHVSPNRYLNSIPLEHRALEGTIVTFKGTHLVSEANCVHVHVRGRAWREKTWHIQIGDVLDSLEADHKAGFPQIFAGDLNTGVNFNGRQVLGLLKKRFGNHVTHVHNGGLDHIFLISTPKVKLSELGTETVTDDNSDHDFVTARIRAELV